MQLRRSIPLLVLVGALASCGGDTDGASKTEKDRGEASMTLGDATWTAERTSAKLVDGKLSIRASRMDMKGGKIARQELMLEVSGFHGADDYRTSLHGSRFIGVALDAPAAEKGDEAATKAATDALTGAQHLMLSAATVVVTAADEDEVSGTFSWEPPPGMKQPAIRDGRFRAPLAK
ncbi:MAG: hypothetical protein H6835_16785 [Planctomycetes bacterium]|nr:hypothetical protein [Planctomycetota bacterium]